MTARTTELRRLLRQNGAVMAPGATDCFVAKLIEQAGFPMIYVTGAGVTNTMLGEPDIGLITLPELAARAGAIARSRKRSRSSPTATRDSAACTT